MMWLVMAYLSIAFRADAVFVSRLQRCDEPNAGQVRRAAAAAREAFADPAPEPGLGADARALLVIGPRTPAAGVRLSKRRAA
jgi:hypothetical protein